MTFNPLRWFRRTPTVRELLESEVKQRQFDIDLSQANLDKFAIAMATCGPEDTEFRNYLAGLSDTTASEQRKEKILLAAVKTLLENGNVV